MLAWEDQVFKEITHGYNQETKYRRKKKRRGNTLNWALIYIYIYIGCLEPP